MIVVSALLPFIYCVLIGMAFGIVFNKRFIVSLAPAFFMQVILMSLTGCLFEKISIGLYIGILVSVIVLLHSFWKKKSFASVTDRFDLGFGLFVFIYVFIFLTNIGSFLYMWDEFSHWGWFVRESYNLDALYCTSDKYFIHRDYPPGISLFEVLWCRLSLGFSEPNAYRGMHILQASMIMPVVVGFLGKNTKETTTGQKVAKIIINTAIMFSIPLFSSLQFYHTLYQDLIMGVIVFYIIWITISEGFDKFSLVTVSLAMANLILCKLTAIAFLPILLIFYVVYHMYYSEASIQKWKIIVGGVLATAVSIVPWRIYNAYIDKYMSRESRGQSYSSLSFASIIGAIKHDGSIAYQSEVESKYFDALFSYSLVGKLSYVWIIVVCVVLAILLSVMIEDKRDRRRVRITTLWMGLAAIYYGIMMYFMYLLMFSEYEATGIASFGRYMSTYVLVALLIEAMLFLYYSGRYIYYSYLAVVLLAQNIVMFSGMDQFLPSFITGEGQYYKDCTALINEYVPDGSSLIMTIALEDLGSDLGVTYNCDAISVSEYAFGKKKYEDDLYSADVSLEEFVDIVSEFDYIYFFSMEEDFYDIYADAFLNPEDIQIGGLYQIGVVDGLIETIPIR
ncbi:hypothetical protein [Butyrivibrio sp. VCB2006]|uniref:hypothetical protein n=1 Tax=Butyrivibrio sp. VCB2006 TaxID=1280679 RepID=UPI00040B8E30|nr:hypothetical protein [Butyrivibrio sp. VCB2006]